ncbi:MAG: hypothetical protein AAF519_04120, partial [Bacteroidota bacterium]
MKTTYQLTTATLLVLVATILGGCSDDEPGNSQDNGQPITDVFQAGQAFDLIKGISAELNSSLNEDFEQGTEFAGDQGIVTITGNKDYTSTSSSSSTSTTSLANIDLSFEGYSSINQVNCTLDGTVSYYNYYRNRVACSSSTCASSSKHSQSVDAESIRITFLSEGGEWITDEL